MKRAMRQVALIGAVALLLAVDVLLAGGVLLVGAIRDYPIDHSPKPADAVLVFAGESGRFPIALQLVEDGVAPVLAVSAEGLPDLPDGWCDGRHVGFEVVCIRPEPSTTEGEAQAFTQLAVQRGWSRVVAVTGDYHAPRVLAWLARCWGGDVSMAALDWPPPPPWLVRKELLGGLAARFGPSICGARTGEAIPVRTATVGLPP